MLRSSAVFFLVLAALFPFACLAQSGIHPFPGSVELHIKIMYQNDRAVPRDLRVDLLSENGETIYEGFCDESGEALFTVSPNTYQVSVSGDGIDTFTSSSFIVHQQEYLHSEFLHVRRTVEAATRTNNGPPVSASNEQNVPAVAQDHFNTGTSFLQLGDLDRAQTSFEEALKIYPKYAAALNNLGLIALDRGDPAQARRFFSRSVEIDPVRVEPVINLSKLLMRSGGSKEAENLLAHASALQPLDPDLLLVLAESQLLSGDLDQAVATANRVSDISSDQEHSMAHLIAGSALQQKRQFKSAVVEYRKFLELNPFHPKAAELRATIQALSSGQPTP